MGHSEALRSRIDIANGHMIKVLRLNTRLERLRAAFPDDPAIPTLEECRAMITGCAGEYRTMLAHYRFAVERAIPHKSFPLPAPSRSNRRAGGVWPAGTVVPTRIAPMGFHRSHDKHG